MSKPTAIALLLCASLAGCNATPKDSQAEQATQVEPITTSDYTKTSGGQLKVEHAAVEVEHVDLALTVYPDKQSIAGSAKLTLKVLNDTDTVKLDLDRVFAVTKVEVNGKAVKSENPEGALTIALDAPLKQGETAKVFIEYSGKPMIAKNAPWKGGIVWDKSKDGQPWVATAVQSEGCDLFWPCIDHPQREPKAMDIHVTVPAPLAAAANGKFIGVDKKEGWNTYHWQTKSAINTYSVSLNIGPLELMQDSYQSRFGNTIDLQYWHLKENAETADKLFAEFPQYLDFFESVIGPYPFGDEKMGVVDTPHLGMEHQTINAYGNKYRADQFGFDWLLHHEFSHEWWGNLVTHNSQDDLWIHEGFGTYMQPLYGQYLYGEQVYQAYLYRQRLRIAGTHPLVTGKSRTDAEVYATGAGGDNYNKGSLFLHTLRSHIGDEAFFKSVREFLYKTDTPKPGNFKPRNVDTPEFIEIVNRNSGQDLTWLFHVYLYQGKLPELVTEYKDNQLHLSWKTQDDAPFPMPVEVSIDGKLVKVDMADNKGMVSAGKQAVVMIDPKAKILRYQDYIVAYREEMIKRRKKNAKKPAK